MAEEDVTVSINDESDEARKLSEYQRSVPLSKVQIEQDEVRDTEHEGWAPRTTENIGDMKPLPEKPAKP
jgi:hypothetical protein